MTADTDTFPAETQKSRRDSVHGVDLLIGVSILWGVEIFTGIALVICLICLSGMPLHIAEHPLALFASTCISGLATLLVTWILVCRKYGKRFLDGFCLTRVSGRTVLVSLLLGIGYALIAAAISCRYSTGEGLMEEIARSPLGFGCLAVLMIFIPPVEELYYRGFLFPALQNSFGSVVATLAVSIWFGAAHVPQLVHDWTSIPLVLLAGTIWTVQRLVTGSLMPSLISHLTYNGSLLLLSVVV